MTYPTQCLSAYCGNILCDGCPTRPLLAEHFRSRGLLDTYEQRQADLREQKKTNTGLWKTTEGV